LREVGAVGENEGERKRNRREEEGGEGQEIEGEAEKGTYRIIKAVLSFGN